MGTTNTKEYKLFQNPKIGGLSICLEKQYYFPGEEVKGNIWIQVFQDLEVYGMDLKIMMHEKWHYREGKYVYNRENLQNIINVSINIQGALDESGQNYKLIKGSYNFPFIQIIPEYVYPSFEFASSQSNTNMRYIIYSCLLATKGDKYSLSNINYLVVKSRAKPLNYPLTYYSCRNVHTWIFLEKGTCLLNATYPKSNYYFGEFINLSCSIDNSRCKLKVNYIKVCLIQKIIFKTPNTKRTCYESEIKKIRLRIDVEPGEVIKDLPIEVQLINEKINVIFYEDNNIPYMSLLNSTNSIYNFQPSINSSLINCRYFIKVSLGFDGVVTFENRPRIIMPIHLAHELFENDLNDISEYIIKGLRDPVENINSSPIQNEIENINFY